MTSITPHFSPVRNNPLASASTGVFLIGVAITTIGVLALVGVVPGIGSIGAICSIAGGGTLTAVGALGMLKGFILTNARLGQCVLGCFNRLLEMKPPTLIEDDDIEVSDQEKEFLLTPQNTPPLLNHIEKQLAEMIASTSSAYVKIPVKAGTQDSLLYCHYTPAAASFQWFQTIPDRVVIYKFSKYDRTKPWSSSNFEKSMEKVEVTTEEVTAFANRFPADSCLRVDLGAFTMPSTALASSRPELEEASSGSEEEALPINFSDHPLSVKDFQAGLTAMNDAETKLNALQNQYAVMQLNDSPKEFLIGIKGIVTSAPAWYKYNSETNLGWILKKGTGKKQWDAHFEFFERISMDQAFFTENLADHKPLKLT